MTPYWVLFIVFYGGVTCDPVPHPMGQCTVEPAKQYSSLEDCRRFAPSDIDKLSHQNPGMYATSANWRCKKYGGGFETKQQPKITINHSDLLDDK
jgi:hypothetical protein